MNIRFLYPRSFRRLLTLGLLALALPLLIGLVNSALELRRLSNISIRAVHQASLATQASRQLAENMLAQERAVRQYLVLGDHALWQAYQESHHRFRRIAERLASTSLNEVQSQELVGLNEAEIKLHALLEEYQRNGTGAGDRAWQAQVVTRFAGLAEISRRLSQETDLAIDQEIERLLHLADDAEHAVIVQLAALAPLVALIVFALSRLLTSPIAQIEKAIDGLRAGRFEKPIAIHGPSDLTLLGQELDRLRLRLVELEEQKSRFLRQISHELKTPLTALREGSDLLLEGAVGPLTPPQQEVAGILRDNSLRLRGLIEDLLDYSAAEFAQTALRRQRFPLPELIEAVIECQNLAAQARQLNWQRTLAPIVVNADRERLRAVIDNLLSNAIKYSPNGGTIRLSAQVEGNEAVIDITDDGPGIAEADRPHIFEPFYQGRPPAHGSVKSSGIGLSIAREHVLAHGGSLQLLPGPGARFQIRLPLQ